MAKHITVKFAQGPQRALHYASKPGRVKGFRIFSNNLTAYELTQTAISFTTPCILGAAILDISKTLVYDFHYGCYVLPKYGDKAQLLFTDTDSLCYHITTEDIYADMLQHKEKFDMAGYHPSFAALNGGEQLQHSENKKSDWKNERRTRGSMSKHRMQALPRLHAATARHSSILWPAS